SPAFRGPLITVLSRVRVLPGPPRHVTAVTRFPVSEIMPKHGALMLPHSLGRVRSAFFVPGRSGGRRAPAPDIPTSIVPAFGELACATWIYLCRGASGIDM